MSLEILQIAQRVENLERAAAFYELLLETPRIASPNFPTLVFFNLGVARLLLDERASSTVLYVLVDDVRAQVERLRASGVEITQEPHVVFTHEDDLLGPADTDEVMAFVRDSEGNTVALASHEPRHTP